MLDQIPLPPTAVSY